MNKFFPVKRKRYVGFSRKERLFEIKRKIFHLFGILFPVCTYFFNQKTLLIISILIYIPLIIIDYNKWFFILRGNKKDSVDFFSFFSRKKELKFGVLSGLPWIFLGYIVVITFCEKNLVIVSMSILVVCDAMASLVGKNFGRTKIFNKSFEGSISFFVSGYFVICILSYYLPNFTLKTNLLLLSLVITTITELVSSKIKLDDNFSIPLSFCLAYNILLIIYE